MEQHPRIQYIANNLGAEVRYTWHKKKVHIIQGVRLPCNIIIAPKGNAKGEFETHIDHVKLIVVNDV